MNNDKLETFKEAIKKAQEAQKKPFIIDKEKLNNPEALEKFRARIQEMMRKAEETKE